jgi:hypothetical protein
MFNEVKDFLSIISVVKFLIKIFLWQWHFHANFRNFVLIF